MSKKTPSGPVIKEDGHEMQLQLIHQIYKPKKVVVCGANGEKQTVEKEVLDKEVTLKRWFQKDSVVAIQDYITVKNTIAKNRCLVYDKYSNQYFTVNHSPEEVREAKKPKPQRIGY